MERHVAILILNLFWISMVVLLSYVAFSILKAAMRIKASHSKTPPM